ncbi:hypothetical protein ACFFX0_12990 [Citricoccus parietis]|uniref:Uncharacterized protein n=1 Tax=Citricoccus parietis TaxID=592307 RepID=A0ABV5FZH2_9MICC
MAGFVEAGGPSGVNRRGRQQPVAEANDIPCLETLPADTVATCLSAGEGRVLQRFRQCASMDHEAIVVRWKVLQVQTGQPVDNCGSVSGGPGWWPTTSC